jgi:hypothetical protein
MVHENKRGRSPERVARGRLRGRGGLHEIVGIAKGTKFNDTESDELVPLDRTVNIRGVEIAYLFL